MKSLALFFILFIVTSCSKNDDSTDIPECILKSIERFKIDHGCDNSKVDEYSFQNEKVYVLDNAYCCCDYASTVLNSQCDTIGFLGGFVGNTKVNGEDFSNSILTRNLWKK